MVPEPSLSEVSTWLAELPLANTRYCFDAIEAILESFNHRPELQAVVRVELAELLRPAVQMLAQRAEARFIDAPVPYGADAEFYIAQGIKLHRELGMCYALAAFDAVVVGRRWRGENPQSLALYRAQEHWGQVLLWTSQLYRTVDEEYWMILYRLFRVAATRQALATVFDEPDEPEACRTIAGLFTRTVLFSVANTKRLRQRDMAVIHKTLGRLADQAWLGTEMVRDDQMAEFYFDLDSALPPARTRLSAHVEVSDPRFLHAHVLARTLLETETGTGEASYKTLHERSVSIRVAKILAGLEKRRYARRAETDKCWCVTKLSAVVAALSGADGLGMEGVPQRAIEFELVKESHERHSGDKFETRVLRSELGLGHLLSKRKGTSAVDIWPGVPEGILPKEKPHPPIQGKLVNSSSRGCCIAWPADPMAQTKVGELIGVWMGEPAKRLRFIAVIRWLECDRSGLILGVELLGPSAQVVELYDSASKPMGKALLLPVDGILRTAPELLALPGGIKPGGVVRVGSSEDAVVSYWVREALEATPSFVRYALTEMDAEADMA